MGIHTNNVTVVVNEDDEDDDGDEDGILKVMRRCVVEICILKDNRSIKSIFI